MGSGWQSTRAESSAFFYRICADKASCTLTSFLAGTDSSRLQIAVLVKGWEVRPFHGECVLDPKKYLPSQSVSSCQQAVPCLMWDQCNPEGCYNVRCSSYITHSPCGAALYSWEFLQDEGLESPENFVVLWGHACGIVLVAGPELCPWEWWALARVKLSNTNVCFAYCRGERYHWMRSSAQPSGKFRPGGRGARSWQLHVWVLRQAAASQL